MRVLVTGGAGFIGANLCRRLASQPYIEEIVAYDNLSTGRAENVVGIDCVRLMNADILDTRSLDSAVAQADSVVHLAARPSVPKSLVDPFATHYVNATGTVRVLEAARRVGRAEVILASSSSVYGGTPELPKKESQLPVPLSPYAASKLAAESYALAYAHSFQLRVLVLRFFNVFGPLQPAGHDYAAVIPSFVSSALANRLLTIYGDGLQTRDFTFVDTVTDVICTAVHRNVSYSGPVNLAYGTRTSLLEVIKTLEEILERPLDRHHSEARLGDVRDSQADNTLLRTLIPEVKPVELRAGLVRTIDWFRGSTIS